MVLYDVAAKEGGARRQHRQENERRRRWAPSEVYTMAAAPRSCRCFIRLPRSRSSTLARSGANVLEKEYRMDEIYGYNDGS